jgi:hypothetical protein
MTLTAVNKLAATKACFVREDSTKNCLHDSRDRRSRAAPHATIDEKGKGRMSSLAATAGGAGANARRQTLAAAIEEADPGEPPCRLRDTCLVLAPTGGRFAMVP